MTDQTAEAPNLTGTLEERAYAEVITALAKMMDGKSIDDGNAILQGAVSACAGMATVLGEQANDPALTEQTRGTFIFCLFADAVAEAAETLIEALDTDPGPGTSPLVDGWYAAINRANGELDQELTAHLAAERARLKGKVH